MRGSQGHLGPAVHPLDSGNLQGMFAGIPVISMENTRVAFFIQACQCRTSFSRMALHH